MRILPDPDPQHCRWEFDFNVLNSIFSKRFHIGLVWIISRSANVDYFFFLDRGLMTIAKPTSKDRMMKTNRNSKSLGCKSTPKKTHVTHDNSKSTTEESTATINNSRNEERQVIRKNLWKGFRNSLFFFLTNLVHTYKITELNRKPYYLKNKIRKFKSNRLILAALNKN